MSATEIDVAQEQEEKEEEEEDQTPSLLPLISDYEKMLKPIWPKHKHYFDLTLTFLTSLFGPPSKTLVQKYRAYFYEEDPSMHTQENIFVTVFNHFFLSGERYPLFHDFSENIESDKEEKKAIFEIDSDCTYKPDSLWLLISTNTGYGYQMRKLWNATLIQIVHSLRTIFGGHREKLAKAFGSNARVMALLEKPSHFFCQSESKGFLSALQGFGPIDRIMGQDINVFVYEILLLLSEKKVPRSCLHFLIGACGVPYLGLRTAVDCLHRKKLWLCAISPTYLTEVWWPYVKRYYFDLGAPFKGQGTWTKLIVYAPSSLMITAAQPFMEAFEKIIPLYSEASGGSFPKLEIHIARPEFDEFDDLVPPCLQKTNKRSRR